MAATNDADGQVELLWVNRYELLRFNDLRDGFMLPTAWQFQTTFNQIPARLSERVARWSAWVSGQDSTAALIPAPSAEANDPATCAPAACVPPGTCPPRRV